MNRNIPAGRWLVAATLAFVLWPQTALGGA